MTARREQQADEGTLLDLLMKGDYEGFARLTGYTVEEIEQTLSGMEDPYDDDEDEDDGGFFDGEGDDEEEEGGEADALVRRRPPS